LSNAVLAKGSSKADGKTYVTLTMKSDGDSNVQKDLKNHCIASLQPDVKDQVPLDLYLNVSQNITISCHGACEVHLSGYFEPNNSIEE